MFNLISSKYIGYLSSSVIIDGNQLLSVHNILSTIKLKKQTTKTTPPQQ